MTVSTVLADVNAGIAVLAPVIALADPAAAETVKVFSTVLAGVAALEPTAIALVNQIASGTPATEAQLLAAETACHAALAQLDATLEAQIAAAT
jgi:hypothetical protein